jgi:hypothetical protein
MIVAHVMGIPVEESILQLMPAGLAVAATGAMAVRAKLRSFRRKLPYRSAEKGR